MPIETLEQAQAEIRTLQGKIDTLESDNFKAREARRSAERERDELKDKVPADGSVVVSKQDAADLASYRELGKLDKVKGDLESSKTALADVARLQRSQNVSDAAGTKYNRKALETFLPADATVVKDGEGDKAAWVVKQGDTATALDAWVKTTEQEFGVPLTLKSSSVGGGSNPPPAADGKPASLLDALEAEEKAR